MTEPVGRWKRGLARGLALLAFATVPAGLCQLTAKSPRHRHLHVEAFRYGKEPSVIRCNRGDWLHLSFSTRDTGHSFFLEEFDVDAKIMPGQGKVLLFRTRRPETPPKSVSEVVIHAEHPGWLRYLVSKSQFRCHVWCGPMHAFEHGNLLIGPNTLLWAAYGLLAGIPLVGLMGLRSSLRSDSAATVPVSRTDGWNLFEHLPWMKRVVKWRGLQFSLMLVTMTVLYFVVLTALFGTKVAGRNFGVMATWVVWLFLLTAVLVPLGGRIWCLACPLPMFGDLLQRRAATGVRTGSTRGYNSRFFGWNLPWPKRLANDWPRTVVFLTMGTFSTALVVVPRYSGWIIVSLVLLATLMAMIWELRAFCRYLCPVTAFVGLYGKLGMLALRADRLSVCKRCRSRACLKGSDKGWACPFGLCVAQIKENTDCGMCTECIKTCPYDNVSLRVRPFAHEMPIRSGGEARLAMGMLVLAAAYCLVHLGHWPALRDCVNIFDKGNWGLFLTFAALLWFTALVVMPATIFALALAGKRLARLMQPTRSVARACCGALVPLGLMLWIAFVVPMILVNFTFVLQSVSDPFGLNWNLFGMANTPWHQIWPRAIPWIQAGCLLVGLDYSLRSAWRIWLQLTGKPHAALLGMMPISGFLVVFSGCFVWFFAN